MLKLKAEVKNTGGLIRTKAVIPGVLIGAFLVMMFCVNAFAQSASISLVPRLGGTQLTFNCYAGSECQAELEVTISGTIAQYEVRQELSLPLSSGRDELAWRDLSLWGEVGSNAAGNLRVLGDYPGRPMESVDTVYTSSSSGVSDRFVLIYNLKLPQATPVGSYTGRVRFIFQPVTAQQNQVDSFLTFNVNVGNSFPGDSSQPEIEINPLTGLNKIYLDSHSEDKKAFDVAVKINRNSREFFRITQTADEDFLSSEGNLLNYQAVNYMVSDASKGSSPATATPLTKGMMDVYSSTPQGEVDRDFIITYSLGDLAAAQAGIYKTKIMFYLEDLGVQKPIGSLDLEVEVGRIFELSITPQRQEDILEFSDLKPDGPVQINDVLIEVKSNLGKPYQVSQNVLTDLTDQQGNIIPPEKLLLNTEAMDTKGALKCPAAMPVVKGDTVLFVSDKAGSPDIFKVVYQLGVSWKEKAGAYSSRVTYSLSEI